MITWKLLFSEGNFFVVGNEYFFVVLGGILPPPFHLQGFSQMVGLGEGVEHSIYGGGNKQDESRWKIFGKIGNTGGIIILLDTILY